jgi:hypothetical protein
MTFKGPRQALLVEMDPAGSAVSIGRGEEHSG